MSNIRLDGIEVEIQKELSGYQKTVKEIVGEACRETAESCLEEIKENSPVDTGEYRRGWKLKEEANNALRVSYVIKNTTKPHLTHLLENGHAIVTAGGYTDGGRVAARPHIGPAERNAKIKLAKFIEEALKNGT